MWLQFCPTCLAEDETPYFRQAWRRASVMTCRRHQRPLLDRCPSCRHGIAPFEQHALLPQHRCAHCCFDLRQAISPGMNKATRQAAEVIDDLVRLEAAKGFLEKSTLIARVLALPSLQERPGHGKFTRLSTAERIRCVAHVGNCFDRRFEKHLRAERGATIAALRQTIVSAGGNRRQHGTLAASAIRNRCSPLRPGATRLAARSLLCDSGHVETRIAITGASSAPT